MGSDAQGSTLRGYKGGTPRLSIFPAVAAAGHVRPITSDPGPVATPTKVHHVNRRRNPSPRGRGRCARSPTVAVVPAGRWRPRPISHRASVGLRSAAKTLSAPAQGAHGREEERNSSMADNTPRREDKLTYPLTHSLTHTRTHTLALRTHAHTLLLSGGPAGRRGRRRPRLARRPLSPPRPRVPRAPLFPSLWRGVGVGSREPRGSGPLGGARRWGPAGDGAAGGPTGTAKAPRRRTRTA